MLARYFWQFHRVQHMKIKGSQIRRIPNWLKKTLKDPKTKLIFAEVL